MADIEQLKEALVKAHQAGDTKAAQIFAEDIKKLQAEDQFDYSGEIPRLKSEIPTPEEEPTIGEKVVGAAETGATVATGVTTGAIGSIYGTLKGLAKELMSGKFGTKEAAKRIEQTAQEAAQGLTYEPKTETGKEYTQKVAETLTPLEGLTPMATEMGALTRTTKQNLPKGEKPPKPTQGIEGEIGGTTMEGIAEMSVKAAQGNKKSLDELSKQVKMNPEAIDAADKLGIDLPADILGDNQMIKQTAGLVRSQAASDDAVQFANMIEKSVDKADEAFSAIEKSDLATMSGKIMDSFNQQLKNLSKQAEDIYKKTTNQIPKNTEVQLINSVDTVNKYLDDLGIAPDAEGKIDLRGLTKEEKDLYRLVTSPKVTFGALERERRAIGEALGKLPTGKYVNSDKSLLKKLYASIKKDQLDNVESVLGKEAREQLHLADRTFQKKIALEERAAKLFGKDGDKSVAPLLRRALLQGSKGDVTALNQIFKNVPQELLKESLGAGLSDIVTSRNGKFNFNDYVKVYQGLRANPPIYNKVIKTLGSDKDELLQRLYVVSKRIVEAKNKIIHTGKANQQILKQMQEEALLQRVIRFTVEKGVQKITFGGLSPSLDMLFKSPKEKIKAVGDLFNSPEFKDLAISAINEVPGGDKITKLVSSKAFKNWVKSTGKTIKDPEGWILTAFTQDKGENDENNK